MWSFQSLLRCHCPRNQFCQIAKSSTFISPAESERMDSVRYNHIGRILNRVKEEHGLKSTYPHIQYLIGEGGGDSGQLDLGDKTQSILQSAHPVSYIIRREIRNWDRSGNSQQTLNYHNWVTLLGRSLIPINKPAEEFDTFASQLDCIANAAESGMFSSDVHNTVVNIPSGSSNHIHHEMNLGNKYAALVGDYFAVKAIFFAERAKNSQVILSITQGVEDFTSAGCSRLVDPLVWTPFITFPRATVNDWAEYYAMASGYFTGGCYAVLNVLPHTLPPASKILNLVTHLALFVQTVKELDDLVTKDLMISPFLLTSLPGILYQQMYPNAYDVFRVRLHPNDYSTLSSELSDIRGEITRSDVIQQTIEIMDKYAQIVKSELLSIASNEFYATALRDLVDVIRNTSNSHPSQ